jgi:hypothetical protein
MMLYLEPLLCPCCTSAVLYTLSQYSTQVFSQSLLLLGSGSLSTAIGLSQPPQTTNSQVAVNHEVSGNCDSRLSQSQ